MLRSALLATFLLFSISMQAANAITTIILIRHAEKATTGGSDVALSETGQARAKELARILADANITAIYVTQYKRTHQTVQPLADALGVKPQMIHVDTSNREYETNLLRDIREKHAGETVLVAGHNVTVDFVLRELGAKERFNIPEPEFDRLIVCTITEGAAPKVVALRYGALAH